jgi:hypothetical protein
MTISGLKIHVIQRSKVEGAAGFATKLAINLGFYGIYVFVSSLACPPFYVANGEISHTLVPIALSPPASCNEFLPDVIWWSGMLVT